jgi:hypothetical protein
MLVLVALVGVLIDSARMQGLWMRVDLRGRCIGAACGAALHKPVVIASCEQRAGHTREKLPCPVCDWAVSMSDNEQSYILVLAHHALNVIKITELKF